MRAPQILMMAAGTGGHVFPALAVAEELSSRGAQIHWLGTPGGMENDLVGPTGYTFHAINMQGLRGKGVGRLLKLPSTLLAATLAAVKIIRARWAARSLPSAAAGRGWHGADPTCHPARPRVPSPARTVPGHSRPVGASGARALPPR